MSSGEINGFSVVEIKAWVGSRLEKGVKRPGSMKEQFSKIEKGLDVSRAGGGILSRISSMMSWGKVSSPVEGISPFGLNMGNSNAIYLACIGYGKIIHRKNTWACIRCRRSYL